MYRTLAALAICLWTTPWWSMCCRGQDSYWNRVDLTELPASLSSSASRFETGSAVESQPVLVGPVEGAPDSRLPEMQSPANHSRFLSFGEFRLVPYGSLWTNALIASSRTTPGPFTLWVLPESVQGETAFEIDARRTRVGFDLTGPELTLAGEQFETAAQVEIDFFGEFLTENNTGARLRQAYWEFNNPQWRFLVGQTWDIINPLRPNTLNFSVGWAGGNLGFRRTQFRVERRMSGPRGGTVLVQTSMNQDIVSDFPAELGVRRESAAYPVFMSRLSYSVPTQSKSEATLGFSGHFGETGFDFVTAGPPPLSLPPEDDTRFPTWSLNLDCQLPIGSSILVQGEAFHGANLSPFLGGIGQGVCPCERVAIRSTGGWIEIAKFWPNQMETHFGSGIDDPNNGDFLVGRGMNQFVFANHIWRCSEHLSTGLELTWWRTAFTERRLGLIPSEQLQPNGFAQSYVTEWMIRYDF